MLSQLLILDEAGAGLGWAALSVMDASKLSRPSVKPCCWDEWMGVTAANSLELWIVRPCILQGGDGQHRAPSY